MKRNYPAAAGFQRPGHHETDPGGWMRARRPHPLPEEDFGQRELEAWAVPATPLWDWAYLTPPNDELWTDLWCEWPDNMEAD